MHCGSYKREKIRNGCGFSKCALYSVFYVFFLHGGLFNTVRDSLCVMYVMYRNVRCSDFYFKSFFFFYCAYTVTIKDLKLNKSGIIFIYSLGFKSANFASLGGHKGAEKPRRLEHVQNREPRTGYFKCLI